MGHEGHGIKIQKGGSFVAEVIDIQLPGASVNTIDMSTQDTVGLRELIASAIAEPGSGTITVRFNPDDTGLPVIGGSPEVVKFIFSLIENAEIEFYGFFTSWDPGTFTSGQPMEASMTLQRTGWVPSQTTPGSGGGINPLTGDPVT